MKQIIKIYAMILLCFSHWSDIFAPTFGTAANAQLQRLAGVGSTSQTTSTTNNPGSQCPACTTTTTTPLPSFIINLYGVTTTSTTQASLLNSYTFTTPTTFLFSSAILSVDIFPPSNFLMPGTIKPINSATENYAIVYTLKSLDGTTLQKAMQYGASTVVNQNPNPIIQPTTFPTAISISTSTMTTGATTATITPLFNQPLNFFPNSLSSHSLVTQQRIFNAIGIIHQEFLITSAGSTVSASALSGMFNTGDGTTLSSCFFTSQGGSAIAITQTQGSPLTSPITIGLPGTSQQPITFPTAQSSQFNTTDLQNGLALNINIYPNSTNSTTNNYILIATLRTTDGLKLHKQIAQFSGVSSIPSQISIQYDSAMFLAEYWISQQISPNQQNLSLPANLRFIIQKTIANPNCTIIQI